MGIEFDGWQDGTGQLMLAKRIDGKLAHTIGGFGMSVCRQAGKTFLYGGSLFGLSQHYPGLLTIWTAHHSKTSGETFLAMQALAARSRIAPFIDQVYTGSGDEEIRFHNKSRILFGARERGFGRGVPGVDVLVSDEGQILSERALQNMLATLNTSQLGLHIYLGTPPTPENNSESWMRMRDEAWVGGAEAPMQIETEDMVWIEIGADDGADLDDLEQYAKANPSFPHRTPIESIMRLRRKLNDDGFRREALGLYDTDDASVFDVAKWNTLAVDDAEQPKRAALVLDISPDRRWSAISIAGNLIKNLDIETDIEAERILVLIKSVRGTDSVAKAIEDLAAEQDLFDIAITPGAARAVETDLTKLGIEYSIMTGTEVAAAYANLQEKIKSGGVAHIAQPELDFALINSKSRYLQTGESESFDRRGYSVDTSPAVAAACALYRFGLNDSPIPYIG